MFFCLTRVNEFLWYLLKVSERSLQGSGGWLRRRVDRQQRLLRLRLWPTPAGGYPLHREGTLEPGVLRGSQDVSVGAIEYSFWSNWNTYTNTWRERERDADSYADAAYTRTQQNKNIIPIFLTNNLCLGLLVRIGFTRERMFRSTITIIYVVYNTYNKLKLLHTPHTHTYALIVCLAFVEDSRPFTSSSINHF